MGSAYCSGIACGGENMIGLNDILWCVVGVAAGAIVVLALVCFGIHDPDVNPSEREDDPPCTE
jgi:hypothetical protein